MFTLKAESTFEWPVVAKAPKNGGTYEKVTFNATFRVLSQEVINNLSDSGSLSTGSVRVLREALVSFTGLDVAEEDGEQVTDFDRRIEIILDHPYMVKALSDAFASGMAGKAIKN